MHTNSSERVIAEVRQPLMRAAAYLSSQASKIRKTWSKQLLRYDGCAEHAPVLNTLHLNTRIRELRSSTPHAYREEAERQGADLARRGVPMFCAVAAVAVYVESCLPCLPAEDTRFVRWTRALNRWATVYTYLLLCGYTRHAQAEIHALEEKVAAAERRSQGFSIKLGDAYEKERRRLAQDLHDEIGHDLIVLKLYTEVIALDLKKGELGEVRRKLKESVSLIKHALKGVRHLTFDLGPAVWSEQGFLSAVRLYVRQFANRTGIHVRFSSARMKIQLPARYESALYKVLQGALSNVAAHSAASRVEITLANRKDCVLMKIKDDGRGFGVERKLNVPARSYGLRAMRDRIELLGGSIRFSARTAGRSSGQHGTSVELSLPLHDVTAT